MMKFAGMKTARLDLLYMQAKQGGQNPMDINTSPGFALLGAYGDLPCTL